MKFGNLLLAGMLMASLLGAKKPPAQHDWQTGTLLKILKVDELGHFEDRELGMKGQLSNANTGSESFGRGRVILVIQGQSSTVTALLRSEQPEPNIRLHGPVKYAIETVPCRYLDNCGSRTTPPDEFGRTHEVKIRTLTYLYLLDEDNRVSRLTFVNERKLPMPLVPPPPTTGYHGLPLPAPPPNPSDEPPR